MGTPSATVRAATKEPQGRAELEAQAWEAMGDMFMLQKPRMMALCRELDLFPPQLMVLRSLDRPRPMSDVAATLACDSSNLTGITDRLEERGLVMRAADEKDRRVKLLVLTEAGRRMRRKVIGRLQKPPPEIHSLSDRDLEQLRRLIRKALAGADR